jgi:hypothetical protein
LRLTAAGDTRFQETRQAWMEAQQSFETGFGPKRSAELRTLLRALIDSGLISQIEG